MIFPKVNIFIDGGGNNCIGVKKYLNKFPKFHKIYVFEPNPLFYNSYKESNFILIKKAIWTSNCKLPFYISKDEKQIGSSLLQEKLCKINNEIKPFFKESIEVECIDFSEWIKDNFKIYYNITLKLDIEGAEFDVLYKMIKDGTIKYVKKLFVEFHTDTVKRDYDKLIKQLKNCGINPQHWD